MNTQKRYANVVTFTILLLVQSYRSEPEMITIDVRKANSLLRDGGYRYLDVRTSEEYMKGHVDFDDALNVPYMIDTHQGRVKNGNFLEQVLSLCNKGDHLVVGCKSGVRSVYASNALLEAGFKHVYNMRGGYLAWLENDLPVAS
ncbi:hypothetical protein L1987_74735 [Smallanthus sonchifolius]|uniref:Uncharacterized protein n=1 Tax=Smallanthus sonchifolius TaxID=185202 RepID=A0ACB9A3X0_9ASTR|nr:hypothetical protein L1987_74735 [Smallanthus sonchifolius]